MSGAPKMAETTAAPAAPLPRSSRILRAFTPPMATTGMRTAAQISRRPAGVSREASVLVAEPKTAPAPR